MLDFRKPYVLMTKKSRERVWRGDDENLPAIAIKCICEHGRKEDDENPRKTYLQYRELYINGARQNIPVAVDDFPMADNLTTNGKFTIREKREKRSLPS